MTSTQTYSFKKDGEKYLSKNFKVKQFRCKDGSDTIKICQETVDILQAIRDYFGRPVIINSAYRTPSWNKKVGGTSASQHVMGTACDIKVPGVIPEAIAGYLEANFPKHGIGLYSTFVHVDSRGRKVYWKNTGSNVVASFRQGDSYKKYRVKEKPVTTPIISKEEKEEIKMTDKEIYEALQRYIKTLTLPNWAEKEFKEAKELGITDGSDPMTLIPRYQAAIMAKRTIKKENEDIPKWAKKEFDEAVAMGITDGSDPLNPIPRYQAAIMAKRAVEKTTK